MRARMANPQTYRGRKPRRLGAATTRAARWRRLRHMGALCSLVGARGMPGMSYKSHDRSNPLVHRRFRAFAPRFTVAVCLMRGPRWHSGCDAIAHVPRLAGSRRCTLTRVRKGSVRLRKRAGARHQRHQRAAMPDRLRRGDLFRDAVRNVRRVSDPECAALH